MNDTPKKNEILIQEIKDDQCRHPEHDPASMVVRKAGIYQHTCPSCGKVEQFTVPLITL